jgi:hypothetical protein
MLLSAIASRRLVIFTGAGLSMPAPSNLPSARSLAEACALKHEEVSGEPIDAALHSDIEAQARYFHARNQLQSYFLQTLVDWRPFVGTPNSGHYAIADFLLSQVVDLSISANVDVLVENAAEILGRVPFQACIDGTEAAIPRPYMPLMKIHGCVRRGPEHTLWCHEQLDEPEWHHRIGNSVQWLSGRLMQRDILFVGYWTDWSYLNDLLGVLLSDQVPQSVTLVDPSEPAVLEQKAEALWLWAHRPGINFTHVQASGAEFLADLRYRYSLLLLKRIAKAGALAFEAATQAACPPFPAATNASVDDLYDLRRDWEGVRRDEVATKRDVDSSSELLGKLFCQLIQAGAVIEGSSIVVAGKRLRLLQAAGRMLYSVRAHVSGDISPASSPDITVCVGAEDDGNVPVDVIRAGQRPSIIRPGDAGEWCTHGGLHDLLGIG